jgi:hypothetical protein
MTHAHTEIEIGTVTERADAENITRPLQKQLRTAHGTAAADYEIDVTPNTGDLLGYRVVVRHPKLSADQLQSRILAVLSQVMVFQWKPWH